MSFANGDKEVGANYRIACARIATVMEVIIIAKVHFTGTLRGRQELHI